MPGQMKVKEMEQLMRYLDSKVDMGVIKEATFVGPQPNAGYSDLLLTGLTEDMWLRVISKEVSRHACVDRVVTGEGHVMSLGSVPNGYIYPGPFVRIVISQKVE